MAEDAAKPEPQFVSERLNMMVSAIYGPSKREIMLEYIVKNGLVDQFKHVWKMENVHEVIVFEKEFSPKSAKEALEFRTKGNNYFKKKSYLSAVSAYNDCILKALNDAPGDGDNDLALAFANRSAAFFHLRQYKECLVDIDNALSANYNVQLKFKLFDRMGKCYLKLKEKEKAINGFNMTLNALASAKLDEDNLEKWKADVAKQLEECDLIPSESKCCDKSDPLCVTGQANETYPNASDLIEVKHSKKAGRHLVAEQPLEIGDTVISEKPYASVLFQEFYTTHCYNCQKRASNPVPCTNCSSIVFCGHECRDIAWNTFHKFECEYLVLFDRTLCAKIGHLAVRLLMVYGLRNVMTYLHNKKNESQSNIEEQDPLKLGTNKAGIYTSSYDTVYNLHTDIEEVDMDDQFSYTVMAAYLVKFLLISGYLTQDGEDFTDETSLCMIGSLLMHHLQLLQLNSKQIVELQDPNNFDSPKPAELGAAIYHTAALLNHSCDPNVTLVFHGNHLVVKASRVIDVGEQVCCSYGPLFFDIVEKQRNKILDEQFYFKCKCSACEEEWPLLMNFDYNVMGLRCTGCCRQLEYEELEEKRYATCGNCSVRTDLQIVMGKLEISHGDYCKAMHNAFTGKIVEALSDFTTHLHVMQKLLCQPWRDITACQGAIRQCHRLQGNIKPTLLFM